MIPRLVKLSKSRSFFLFGPRGVGKSTLLDAHFKDESVYAVSFLDSEVERRLALRPERLLEEWKALPKNTRQSKWIIIDEVQRLPKILDAVHLGIESLGLKFALTGSSARKIRRGSANLLAGRASEFYLHPLSFVELGSQFDLKDALQWGTLPASFNLRNDLEERRRFLNAYVNTYLREEIQAEQIVRNMEPFRMFIEVAATANGKILNASKVGRQCGVDPKTSQRYFEILADTLIGFFLPAFDRSVRKQQARHPKFYWFDVGVSRAASGMLDDRIGDSTYEYGNSFEHLVIVEAKRLNDMLETHARLFYFQSADGAEIDLIVRKGKRLSAIEIKSTDKPDISEIRKHANLSSVLGKNTTPYILCTTKVAALIEGVWVMPWEQGLREIFGLPQ
jgi:predicted AAA+ superfamily ATPase